MFILVLDINGVLADVRKIGTDGPKNRGPDAITQQSQQQVYLRPGLRDFISGLSRKDMQIVLWTSRLSRNSWAIEYELRKRGLRPHKTLHGEDCIHKQDVYPVKDIDTVRKACGVPSNTTVVFCDDHPDRVIGGICIPVATYDAMTDENETDTELVTLLYKIDLINANHKCC